MKVVVTGAAQGIGRAIAEEFLAHGHEVCGIDLKSGTIEHSRYKHYTADVSEECQLPDIPDVDILVNNAGSWAQDVDNIEQPGVRYPVHREVCTASRHKVCRQHRICERS